RHIEHPGRTQHHVWAASSFADGEVAPAASRHRGRSSVARAAGSGGRPATVPPFPCIAQFTSRTQHATISTTTPLQSSHDIHTPPDPKLLILSPPSTVVACRPRRTITPDGQYGGCEG